MKKLLFLALAFVSFDVQAHKPGFFLWTSPVVDKSAPDLNVDLPINVSQPFSAGVYRLVTNDGPTNKYVQLAHDGCLRKNWGDFTCFYLKNYDATYDKVGCVDTKKLSQDTYLTVFGYSHKRK